MNIEYRHAQLCAVTKGSEAIDSACNSQKLQRANQLLDVRRRCLGIHYESTNGNFILPGRFLAYPTF